MIKTRKMILPCILIVCIALGFVVPSLIGSIASSRYVATNYAHMNLTFVRMEHFGNAYLAVFEDPSGKIYNFRMSRFVPTTVMYDPLDPPG